MLRTRYLAIAVLLLLCLAATPFGLRRLARARTFQLFGKLVSQVPRRDSLVALTIDDGPLEARTQPMLDTLRAHNARVTFFVIGDRLIASPAAGAAIVSSGNELGNHTWTHNRMWFMRQSRIRDEVERTDSLIRIAGQKGSILFRPPYGYKLVGLPWYLSQTGRTTVMWNIEPDSRNLSAEGIVQHVLERVHPGSIILLHTWYPWRATSRAAVGPLLDSLHARGYRVSTVSELLKP